MKYLGLLLFLFLSHNAFAQSYSSDDVNELLSIKSSCDPNGNLNWSGTNYSSWSGVAWDTTSTPHRVIELYLQNSSLSGILNISPLTKLKIIRCDDNSLTSITADNLDSLTYFQFDNNNITTISTQSSTNIETIRCNDNLIKSFDFSHLSKLKDLNCQNNDLSFSSLKTIIGLPVMTSGYLNYNPQGSVDLGSVSVDSSVDISSEDSVGTTSSNFTWKKDGILNTTDISIRNRKAHFHEKGKYIATITNGLFPNLILTATEINISKGLPKITSAPSVTSIKWLSYLGDATINNDGISSVSGTFSFHIPHSGYSMNDSVGFHNITLLFTPDSLNNYITTTVQATIEVKPVYAESDIKALQDIRLTIDTTNALNWALLSDPGSWSEVKWNTIGNEIRATSLNLDNLNLSGHLVLNRLIELRSISITGNQLTQITANNTNIESINCTNNSIDTLNFTNLSNLSYLELGNNNYSGNISIDFNNFPQLKTLRLFSNEINDINFLGTNTLEELVLSDNNITSINTNISPNLKRLYLKDNQFSSIDVSTIPNLELIDLSENQFTTIDLVSLDSLRSIYLNKNIISNLKLAKANKIEILDIEENDLDSIPLKDLQKLKEFHVKNNYLDFYKLKDIYAIHSNYSSWTSLSYAPQKTKESPLTLFVGDTIDYSRQSIVDNTHTTYKWFKSGNELSPSSSDVSENNHIVTFNKVGTYYAERRNTKLPDLMLTSKNITVNKGMPNLSTWPTLSKIRIGDSLSTADFENIVVSPAGVYSLTNPNKAFSTTGIHKVEALFSPNDTTNYHSITDSLNIEVQKAIPKINSLPSANVYNYLEPLSTYALNGASTQATGTFDFINPSQILDAGTHSVVIRFTPDDLYTYESLDTNITIQVNKIDPMVTNWPKKDLSTELVEGDKQSQVTLDFTNADTHGVFKIDDSSLILIAGYQPVTLVFKPFDDTNYNEIYQDVYMIIKDKPEMKQKPQASAITYGERLIDVVLSSGLFLSNSQFSVDGTFQLITNDRIFSVGTHAIKYAFVPDDATYNSSLEFIINLNIQKKQAPTRVIKTEKELIYGQRLSEINLQNVAQSDINGFFEIKDKDRILNAGTHIVKLVFFPTDNSNYSTVEHDFTLKVKKANPKIITKLTVNNIHYKQVLSEAVIKGKATVEGSFIIENDDRKLLPGTHDIKVIFVPKDSKNHNSINEMSKISVNKLDQNISWNLQQSEIKVGNKIIIPSASDVGLPLDISLSPSSLADLKDGTLTAKSDGKLTITLNQIGTNIYNAGTPITKTIQINKNVLSTNKTFESHVYPIPTRDFIQVTNCKKGEIIRLTNISGKEVLKIKVDNSIMKLDLSPFEKGTYILKKSSTHYKIKIQ